MADDTQRLIVSLEARIDQFQKALDKATGVADDRMSKIQKRFSGGSDAISRGMARIGAQSLATQNQTAKIASGFDRLGEAGKKALPAAVNIAAGMSKIGKQALMAQVEQELMANEMSKVGNTADGVGHKLGSMSTQGMAAFHSLRGGGEMLLQGVSPMRVLAMEMNNLTYAASGPGGLVGAMKEAFGVFRGLLNPIVGVTAGVVGLGLAAVGMQAKWASAQSKIGLALTGVGRASGITVGQINEIADSVAKSGELSRSEASDIATAIASTGRASADSTEKATALAKAYSLAFDKSIDQSATDLANAIAEPGRAIDGLNKRLGVWSAKQVELVKNLTMSGDRQKAAKILIDGLDKSIGDAAQHTDFWSRSWDKVSNSISGFFSAAGRGIDKATGNQSPEDALVDRLSNAKERLDALQSGHFNLLGGVSFGDPAEIKKTSDEIRDITAQLNALRKTSDDSNAAVDVSNLVKGIDPAIQKLNELQSTIDQIRKVPTDHLDEASQGVVANVLASLQSQHDLLAQDIALSQKKYGVTLAQASAEERAAKIEIDAINARTPAQKADIAYLQTRNALLDQGKSPQEAEIGAQIARTKSLTQSQHDLSEAQRDRIYQAGQSVEQQQIENQTIGLGVEAATKLAQRFQLLAAAKAEAHKNGTVVTPEELAAMDEAARKLGELAQASAALNVQNNAKFDISQFGRTQSEQNVYGSLQSAGLLDNGQIVSAQAKQTAEILRTREAMSQLADTEKTFAQSFLSDLMQGKSAAASLGDALTAVANKLLDSGIDALIAGATSSGANKSFLSFLGLADGGVFTPGKGLSSLPRFAGGGVSKKAAIFGEAGPEAAVPLPDGRRIPVDLRMPTIAAPAPVSMPPITISIDARNSTPESVDKLSETLAKLPEMIDQRISHQIGRNTAVRKAIRRA